MNAYQCDDSGFFVGMVECQRNPMRMGQFLLPKNATHAHKPDWCNWYNFELGEWKYKKAIDDIEKFDVLNTIEIVIEGVPSKEQIKMAIAQLISML